MKKFSQILVVLFTLGYPKIYKDIENEKWLNFLYLSMSICKEGRPHFSKLLIRFRNIDTPFNFFILFVNYHDNYHILLS